MIYYRLYFLDRDGRISRAREIHCNDDVEAIGLAAGEQAEAPMELWSHSRLVRRFPAVQPVVARPA